jgi:hypothetical protein
MMRFRFAIMAHVAVAVVFWLPLSALAQPPPCYAWPDGDSLQQAVSAHSCVQLSAGVFVLNGPLRVPEGHEVAGAGMETTVLLANQATFPLWNARIVGEESPSLVETGGIWLPAGGDVVLRDMTIDANGIANQPVGWSNFRLERVRLTGGVCHGAFQAGPNVTIRDSIIDNNAWPNTLPGRGFIRCEKAGGADRGAGIFFNNNKVFRAATIVNTTFQNNYGRDIDCSNSDGGILQRSRLFRAQPAGMMLWYCSGWTIEDNWIEVDPSVRPSDFGCYPVYGAYPAAIEGCHIRNTRILRNYLSSWFAIILDDAPLTTMDGNTLVGVVYVDPPPVSAERPPRFW